METTFISRVGGLGACALLAASVDCSMSSANAQTAAVANGACPYWIDAKIGKPVSSSRLVPDGSQASSDANHRTITGPISGTFANFVRTGDGTWINSATGTPVPPSQLVPEGSVPASDSDHRTITGPISGTFVNFVRIPCPPPVQSAASGLYLGGELVKNWGWVRSTERLASTDAVTNQFSDRADPVGGGLLIGYKFAPWANSVIVSPFGSFDFIDAPVNHTFAGGSYLGTTAKFMGTFGVKAGPQVVAGIWLYGIAGVSVLNETLNINFVPVSSSQSAWVAGGTLGVGGAWQPAFLQGYGRPVSLFAEYQHTWWQDANFNTPAASPFFNYTFARQDDLVKFGFTVDLSLPPQQPRVTLPTK